MKRHKYPYIPRDYYPAVMFACRIIRESGNFNRAIRASASYYGVDATLLADHVRKRQGAGQSGRRRGSYRWFVVRTQSWSEGSGYGTSSYEVVKGLSVDSVSRRFSNRNHRMTVANDYGGAYAPCWSSEVFGPYPTEGEAEDEMRGLMESKVDE